MSLCYFFTKVYKSQARKPSKEDAAIDPWTGQAKAKLAAEKEVEHTAAWAMKSYMTPNWIILYAGSGSVEQNR